MTLGIIDTHVFCNFCGEPVENKFCCAERMWEDINLSLDKGTLTTNQMDAHMSRIVSFDDMEDDPSYERIQEILNQNNED